MPSYECCDCGEIKATKHDLEAHLNSDHIGWTPYQCFYCCQQGVSTRKPSKEMLREHVTQTHPNKVFTFMCTDNQTNEDRLKDMINRSTSNNQSPDIEPTTLMSVSAANETPPFVISLSVSPHPQLKEEVIGVEEFQDTGVETLPEGAEKNADDIKPNLSILGNCRCETCQKCIPRNLMLIRDHVKIHFKEKTGCVPADLTNLLPHLQQVYCQLLLTSFPSVGASILNDDIPNCVQSTNQKEVENNGPVQLDNQNEHIDQMTFGNDMLSVDINSVSFHNSTSSDDYKCKNCGEIFSRLTSLKSHVTNCKVNNVNDGPKSSTTHVAQIASTRNSSTDKLPSSTHVSCTVCGKNFLSMGSMHSHRGQRHGIVIKRHCKECKLDFDSSSSGGGFRTHLLRVHLKKYTYECSLCGAQVNPGRIDHHDQIHHGGLRKAVAVNNLHHSKTQVDTLQKKLIIDISSSLRSKTKSASIWKPRKKIHHSSLLRTNYHKRSSVKLNHIQNQAQCSKNTGKFVEVDAKKANSDLSCEICSELFSSALEMRLHRYSKHGIVVKWHCKQCNTNIGTTNVNNHLLPIHIGKKKLYECSLCETSVVPSTMANHDIRSHGGLGKATLVNNLQKYKS